MSLVPRAASAVRSLPAPLCTLRDLNVVHPNGTAARRCRDAQEQQRGWFSD